MTDKTQFSVSVGYGESRTTFFLSEFSAEWALLKTLSTKEENQSVLKSLHDTYGNHPVVYYVNAMEPPCPSQSPDTKYFFTRIIMCSSTENYRVVYNEIRDPPKL